jgi:hypothetical protein
MNAKNLPAPPRCRPIRARLAFFLALWLACSLPGATGGELDNLRGERVGWARLRTPSLHWMRHARSDPTLMEFLRSNTSLNIDPTWYVADCDSLAEMCTYPLLFSQGLGSIDTAAGKSNVAEYLRRGGFLLIDACINHQITPDPDAFLLRQADFLADVLPEARVAALPSTHNIYRCYFQIPGGRPPHTFDGAMYDPRWAKHGLYGIFLGQRLAGVVSLSGLQCGWDRMPAEPGHDVACMRMLVNIYVYAMFQGG